MLLIGQNLQIYKSRSFCWISGMLLTSFRPTLFKLKVLPRRSSWWGLSGRRACATRSRVFCICPNTVTLGTISGVPNCVLKRKCPCCFDGHSYFFSTRTRNVFNYCKTNVHGKHLVDIFEGHVENLSFWFIGKYVLLLK